MYQLLKSLDTPPDLALVIRATWRHRGVERPEEKQRVEEDLKLRYYHGGEEVACVQTPRGRAIVAVGKPGTLQRKLRRLKVRGRVTILYPEPWERRPNPALMLRGNEWVENTLKDVAGLLRHTDIDPVTYQKQLRDEWE